MLPTMSRCASRGYRKACWQKHMAEAAWTLPHQQALLSSTPSEEFALGASNPVNGRPVEQSLMHAVCLHLLIHAHGMAKPALPQCIMKLWSDMASARIAEATANSTMKVSRFGALLRSVCDSLPSPVPPQAKRLQHILTRKACPHHFDVESGPHERQYLPELVDVARLHLQVGPTVRIEVGQ